jgi:hypothetical protein
MAVTPRPQALGNRADSAGVGPLPDIVDPDVVVVPSSRLPAQPGYSLATDLSPHRFCPGWLRMLA